MRDAKRGIGRAPATQEGTWSWQPHWLLSAKDVHRSSFCMYQMRQKWASSPRGQRLGWLTELVNPQPNVLLTILKEVKVQKERLEDAYMSAHATSDARLYGTYASLPSQIFFKQGFMQLHGIASDSLCIWGWMTLSFWSSCLCLVSAGITGKNHHCWYRWYWGWSDSFDAHEASTLTTELHPTPPL